MAQHVLTDRVVKQVKPQEKPYRLADGGSLYLYVAPSGALSWQYRYRHDGKPQTASLGKYPSVSLAAAREKADAARKAAAEGKHITIEKRLHRARKVAEVKSTFESVAERWVKHRARRKDWDAPYKAEVEASIRNHLAPLLRLPIGEIDARVVAPVLERVEDSAPYMVEKVRPRLHAILDHGVRLGVLKGNPLPVSKDDAALERRHFPAITSLTALGEILRQARAAEACKGVSRAHVLLVYTAMRVSEVVNAVWDEFDLTSGTWEIPRSRMKAHRNVERGPHAVPLPSALLDELKRWRAEDGPTANYVCLAPRDASKPIVPEACEKFYRRALKLSGKHSPHSWRSAFSTVCREHREDAEDVADLVEAQLDHVIGSRVAAAYDRAKRLERRRALLQWYEQKLVAARDGAEIVPIKRKG